MRRIIIPTGYMGSGSSAITNLVSEFENVNNSHNSFEYVFLHCPNGVFDLEDKLLIGNNAVRSDEAIHSFLDAMKDLYNKKFWWPGNYKNIIGNDFYKEVERYIDELIDIRTNSYWYYQENPNKVMQLKTFINILTKKFIKRDFIKKPLKYNEVLLSYKSPKEFYEITKRFINNVLDMIDSNNQDILLDQLLLPHNLFRMKNYFGDEVKVIVVERDPRDMFVLNKYAWTPKNISVPYSLDVKEFCEQYKNLRNTENKDVSKNVLRIRFEDLVYNYEETKNKVSKFLGYKPRQHINKFKRFSPELSMRNTQVFNSSKEYQKEIKYIEKELKEFLYPFPKKIKSKVENTVE